MQYPLTELHIGNCSLLRYEACSEGTIDSALLLVKRQRQLFSLELCANWQHRTDGTWTTFEQFLDGVENSRQEMSNVLNLESVFFVPNFAGSFR